MLFRLALALGKTISELRATLSYREFRDWCMYFDLEPWGEQRADLRNGIAAANLRNVYAAWAGVPQSATPADFMPYLESADVCTAPVQERELTDDELAAWADAAIFGIPPD